MSADLVPWLAGLAAALASLPVARWLRRATYRKPDEEELPLPGSRWWVAPALGTVVGLITWRVWFAPTARTDAAATLADPGVSGAHPSWVRALLMLTFVVVALACVCLAAMDFDVHRLPDRIMWPTMGFLLAGLAVCAVVAGEWGVLLRVVLAGAACCGGYLLLAVLSLARGSLALGLGDVKLAGVLGMALGWYGWQPVLAGMYAGFLVGGVFAVFLLVTRKVRLEGQLAFGPPMMVGGLIGLLVSPHLFSILL